MEVIYIETPYIKLDQALKFSGCVMTGGDAKNRIEEGYVLVNDAVCTSRGKKLYPGDRFELRPAFEEETVFTCRVEAK